ncbi:MAG: hypothetical protein H7221_09580 [Flavobacterium sp.]|nr:hypothetical protein [Flavobacterium sp.]
MKNFVLLIAILLIAVPSFSQKKGKVKNKKSIRTAIILANTTNVIFEMNKKNGLNQLYLLTGAAKDTLLIKSVAESIIILPASCKLKFFTANATPLLNVTWIENSVIGDAKTKIENITKVNNDIWELAARNQAMSNTQITTNIKEIVYLDRLRNASETQERNRKEGLEFILQPNGDVTLFTKTVTNTMNYNAADKKYKFKKK